MVPFWSVVDVQVVLPELSPGLLSDAGILKDKRSNYPA